jgi:2,3-dihydroxybiphenyl 1,2-dioxygenase
MQIDALGYVGIQTADLEQWATYGTRFLGMQLVGKSYGTLALRMDDRKQRVIVHAGEGEGVSFYGWEVAGAAALEGLAAHLEKSGVSVVRGSRSLADERRVKDLIIFSDPIGNRLEAFHGAETALEPFKPGRSISGFRTGPLGMGHAVLTVERLDDVAPFYTDVLGFQLSDYILRPFKACFFHVNPRHHSLAFIATGKNGIHHLMVELCYLDDVGQAYELGAAPAGDDRHHPRPSHQRSGHLVLFVVAVEISGRIRLGRPQHRPGRLDPARARRRAELVGARGAGRGA